MLKKIVYILFLLWAFFYSFFSIQPALCFHTQQAAFFNDIHFLEYYATKIGGVGTYISNFLFQFLQSNLTGSITIILLTSILSLIIYTALKKLGLNKGLAFLLLPVAISISLFHDYYFPITILVQTIFVALASLIFILFIKKQRYQYFIAFMLYAILYYLFGSGTALIFGLTCIIINLFNASFRLILIKSLLFLLALVALPFIAYKFIFNFSLSQAYFYFLPEVPVTLTYSKSNLLYLLIAIMPLIFMLSYLVSKIKLRGLLQSLAQKKVMQLALYTTTFALLAGVVYSTSEKHLKNIALVDYYTYHQNWNKAIEIAQKDPLFDIRINLNYNRAIDNSGKFLELFFNCPQLLGINSLFPDGLGTPINGIQSSEYYYDINYITKSQHQAYGALVLEPYNPRIIKQLVKTNFVLGNFRAAKTYLDLLSTNKQSQDFYNKYYPYTKDTSLISADPEFAEKRKLQPNNFAVPAQITDRLYDLIDANENTNQQAYEHLQMCYLLDHNLGGFMNMFDASMQFYNKIPEVYEQALLVYIYSTNSRQDLLKFISKNSKEEFSKFMNILKEKDNDLQAAKSSLSDLSDTYMYYIKYLSPKATNLTVKTTK